MRKKIWLLVRDKVVWLLCGVVPGGLHYFQWWYQAAGRSLNLVPPLSAMIPESGIRQRLSMCCRCSTAVFNFRRGFAPWSSLSRKVSRPQGCCTLLTNTVPRCRFSCGFLIATAFVILCVCESASTFVDLVPPAGNLYQKREQQRKGMAHSKRWIERQAYQVQRNER